MSIIVEIEENRFQSDVLDKEGTVLVDFYGADCVVCAAVAHWLDNMMS